MRSLVSVVLLGATVLVGSQAWARPTAAQDSGFGGRIEVPSSGVALTLPDDWVYVLPTPEMLESISGMVEERYADDTLLLEQLESLRAGDVEVTLVAYAPPQPGSEFRGSCYLMAATGEGVPLELWVAQELSAWAYEELAQRPSMTYVDLPIGRAARLDYVERGFGFEAMFSLYLVQSPEVRLWLSCLDLDRPEDRWLSIAETLEFLPDGQSTAPPPSCRLEPDAALLGCQRARSPGNGRS